MLVTSTDFDAIVIGADAGGLMAAAYLARAGLSTLLTERAGRAGGHYINTLKLGGHDRRHGVRRRAAREGLMGVTSSASMQAARFAHRTSMLHSYSSVFA